MSLALDEASKPCKAVIYERASTEFSPVTKSPQTDRLANTNGRETTTRTDEQLARLAQGGDTHAFGHLVERYFTRCLKRAFLVLRNRNDAEEEVQNAFAKAFENLHQFRFEGTFAAWLYQIVQNQCRMRMREHRQAGFVCVDVTSQSTARVELVNQIPSPEDELGAQQVENLLRKEISRIPPPLRTVMLLRDVEELSMGEVAEQLNLSVPAAKSRLMRARKEMRKRLKHRCGEDAQQSLSFTASYPRAVYIQSA